MTQYIQHSNAKITTLIHEYFLDMTRLFDLIRFIPTLFELLHNLINQDVEV